MAITNMFSLAIPTMNRYDKFLSKTLPLYLENPYIDEIVICDETGEDSAKILANFNHSKLRVVKNHKRLGVFRNKHMCCMLAKNDWVALIDSDNYAPEEYFIAAEKYIKSGNLKSNKNVILAPSKARPEFDFTHMNGRVFKKGTNKENRSYEETCPIDFKHSYQTYVNTGNFIVNKYVVENMELATDGHLITRANACDVCLFNTLAMEQNDSEIHMVPGMEYDHRCHDGGLFAANCTETYSTIQEVYSRYHRLA